VAWKPEVREAKFTVEGLSPFFGWLVEASIDLVEWRDVTGEDLLCGKSYITVNRLNTYITNFIRPYLHQIFDNSHGLNST